VLPGTRRRQELFIKISRLGPGKVYVIDTFTEAELLIVGSSLEEAARRQNSPLLSSLMGEIDVALEPHAHIYCMPEDGCGHDAEAA
jgi:hypothetical protein